MESSLPSLPPLPKYDAKYDTALQEKNKDGNTEAAQIQTTPKLPKPKIRLHPMKSNTPLSQYSIYDDSINDIVNEFVTHGVTSSSSRKSSISSAENLPNSLSSLRRQLGALRSQDALFSTKTLEPTTVSYQTEMKDQFETEPYHQSAHKMSILAGITAPGSKQPSIININISRRNSIAANIVAPLSRRSSLTVPSSNPSGNSIHQRRGSLPASSLMPVNIHRNSQPSHVGVDREVILSEYVLTEDNQAPMNASQDYYNYVYSSQNIDVGSLNFITRLESTEIASKVKSKKIKTIGRFLIGDQVGKGSFGKVKEGVCTETLLRVAVKIISKKRAKKVPNGIQSIKRFVSYDFIYREIKLLRKFKHENVISLIDVYCKVEDGSGSTGVFPWFESIEDEPITWVYEDGTRKELKVNILKFYLIFQYCPWTLQGLLEQSEGEKFTIGRAHYFFVQMMNGLYYLHSHSVIHRDIKPGNMLITQGKVLNITDFGVAELFDIYNKNEKMKTNVFAGTHQFLSPEITSGAEEYDGEKLDVWAAGVTLYNMLTGRYPFESDNDRNMLQLYEKISACQLVLPDDMNEEVQDLLQGMLAKRPDDRMSVAQVLAHSWTRRHYPGPKNTAKSTNGSSNSFLKKIKESTMAPYLSQIFNEEIELDLVNRGFYHDVDYNASAEGEKKSAKSKKLFSFMKSKQK